MINRQVKINCIENLPLYDFKRHELNKFRLTFNEMNLPTGIENYESTHTLPQFLN